MALGLAASENIKILGKIKYIGLFASIAIYVGECFVQYNYALYHNPEYFIGTFFMAFFTLLVLIDIQLNYRKIYATLRISSILIYCSHIFFRDLYRIFKAKIPLIQQNSWNEFFIVTIVSLIFSIVVQTAVYKWKVNVLKNLY